MSGPGLMLARAAESFVGVPFRLNGRDPGVGLDCVGLLEASLRAMGRDCSLPVGYRLRQKNIDTYIRAAADLGLVPPSGPVEPGDVLLVRPGPAQHHLLIAGESGCFIHSHAALRRVVRSPAPMAWPVSNRWRLKTV